MTLFRYPGGKSKLNKIIQPLLHKLYSVGSTRSYVEPFFGGGAVGTAFLTSHHTRAILNDADFNLACLWLAIKLYPQQLSLLVSGFNPSVEAFSLFKKELAQARGRVEVADMAMVVELGFRKLAIHQMSYSGLGEKAGGPIGGKTQSSDYAVGCRWNADRIIKSIKTAHNILARPEVMIWNFSSLRFFFSHVDVVYLDPPYYRKGSELYKVSFSEHDHRFLADELLITPAKWLLSYDDCPEIRKLYSWAKIIETPNVSTINSKGIRKIELLITSNELYEKIK